jgi:hypothetical protein
MVVARLKKHPPNREGFSYFRILCGNQFPSGQFCPAELGHAQLITRKKGSDPSDPESYSARRVIPRVPGGGGIDHLALAGFAPEFALVAPEKAHTHVMDNGDDEGLWIGIHESGYRWVGTVEDLPEFEILKRHKFGRTGASAARRPMTLAMAIALEERIDPHGHYGFSAEYGTLGNVPTLPAVIRCPRCPPARASNHVRAPTNDDLRPRTKAQR